MKQERIFEIVFGKFSLKLSGYPSWVIPVILAFLTIIVLSLFL
jgi:hypothetical protein